MEIFPLNLVLAVAVAAATIFLGFLPTRTIRSAFFAQESLRAAIAWGLIAVVSPPAIVHYQIFIAILCLGAWWQFRSDKALNGKMWLSIASGLGISLGVMLILAVTPRAYPPGWTQEAHAFLLASIYLGGAVIGLAYVGYTLTQGMATRSGVTNEVIQRYVGLLVVLVLARTVLLVVTASTLVSPFRSGMHSIPEGAENSSYTSSLLINHFVEFKVAIGLSGIVLPCLAFAARRAIRSGKQVQASHALAGICLIGLALEILVRFYLS